MTCQDLGIHLTSKHLAGVLNDRADNLSRQVSPYEWKLHPAIFDLLDQEWGPHTVDRFASWRTAQLPIYNSYFADPYTSAVDAFAQKWVGNNYINPPFFLLNRVINKVVQDRATATIIAPWWPNQLWFRTLKSISMAVPFRIPATERSMIHCTSKPEPLKNKKWKIFAWRICGGGNYV